MINIGDHWSWRLTSNCSQEGYFLYDSFLPIRVGGDGGVGGVSGVHGVHTE